jgi:hypothetical protein
VQPAANKDLQDLKRLERRHVDAADRIKQRRKRRKGGK